MPVSVKFECDGCGHVIIFGGLPDYRITPDGWTVDNPCPGACYCPECWREFDDKESDNG